MAERVLDFLLSEGQLPDFYENRKERDRLTNAYEKACFEREQDISGQYFRLFRGTWCLCHLGHLSALYEGSGSYSGHGSGCLSRFVVASYRTWHHYCEGTCMPFGMH